MCHDMKQPIVRKAEEFKVTGCSALEPQTMQRKELDDAQRSISASENNLDHFASIPVPSSKLRVDSNLNAHRSNNCVQF